MEPIITALLAVVAVVIVFATTVTIIQQGVYALTQSRRIGLMQLLKAHYRGALLPRLHAAGVAHEGIAARGYAVRFALEMTLPALGRREAGLLARAPVLRRYFGSRLERMSTRAFAEHLASSDAGIALSILPDQELTPLLKECAHEFERYGEAQTEAFRRDTVRGAFAIGIALALLFNVDILRNFSVFAGDSRLAEFVARELLERLPPGEASSAASGEGAAEEGASAQASQSPLAEAGAGAEQIRLALSDLLRLQGEFGAFGLPMGSQAFPYCQPAIGTGQAEHLDSRCRDDLGPVQFGTEPAEKSIRALQLRILQEPSTTLTWFLSVLLAGACFGLGAPFWFDVFRRLAAVAPTRRLAQLADSLAVQGESDRKGQLADGAVLLRSPERVTPEQLTAAFRIASRSLGLKQPGDA